MIGQNWIHRNELLQVDIEPHNNIKVYEELRGNLKVLRDGLKRYGNKIKREDDSHKILYDYGDYYTNNEIFMTDIYNDLGLEYKESGESIKNIDPLESYMSIDYFSKFLDVDSLFS